MKTDLTRPCPACPFRRVSAPGWLGPWNPADVVPHIRHAPFPCHRTIPSDNCPLDHPKLQSCAGAAIMLSNMLTLSRDPDAARHQQTLRNLPSTDSSAVFASEAEFLQHHTGPIGPRLEERHNETANFEI